MSQYTYIVHQEIFPTIEELNDIIINGDAKYPGLYSADAIISIQTHETTGGYHVFWRERKWLNESDCLQSCSAQK